MLISSVATAGERVSATEDTRFYDDLACLRADAPEAASNEQRFVQIDGGGWVKAEEAWFARVSGVSTPMGSGLVAFATREEAARRGAGLALRWNELPAGAGSGQ
jgi:hypothetical protein